MDAPSEGYPRRPGPWWAQLLGVGGFLTLFAVVSLFYGLRFGSELLATQRDGIASINRIEAFQMEQTYQMRQVNERLERIEARLIGLEAAARGPDGGAVP